VNNSNITLNRWGVLVVRVLMKYDEAPALRDVLIEVREIRRSRKESESGSRRRLMEEGGIVIDCELAVKNEAVLAQAIANVEEIVTSGATITAPGGFTFAADPALQLIDITDEPTTDEPIVGVNVTISTTEEAPNDEGDTASVNKAGLALLCAVLGALYARA